MSHKQVLKVKKETKKQSNASTLKKIYLKTGFQGKNLLPTTRLRSSERFLLKENKVSSKPMSRVTPANSRPNSPSNLLGSKQMLLFKIRHFNAQSLRKEGTKTKRSQHIPDPQKEGQTSGRKLIITGQQAQSTL